MPARASSSTARRSRIGSDRRCSCSTPLAEAIGRHVRAGAGAACRRHDCPGAGARDGARPETGRLWVVVRDERPFGSAIPPAACYRYSPDRRAIHAERCSAAVAASFMPMAMRGSIGCTAPTPDGEPPLVEVACWSHVRRKFYDVHHASASPIALEAMERIAALFVIESSVRGQAPEQRLAARVGIRSAATGRVEAVSRAIPEPDQRQKRARRGHPIRSHAMERTAALPGGWSSGDEQQRRRARHASARSGAQKLSLLRLRCRRTARRLCLHHRRDRQRCAASIRWPILPMFSNASRIIPSTRSTPCSPGSGHNSPGQGQN